MRILFLTSEFPYPPQSGGVIKTLSILDYLRRGGHQLRTLCFRRAELSEAQAQWAEEFGSVTSIHLNRSRGAINLLRSYLAGIPLSIFRNRSDEMRRLAAEEVAAGAFDAVFVDGWLMAQYLPEDYAGLKLLHQHNAEHILWERQVLLERGRLRRSLVRREAERVRRYEAGIMAWFDIVFAVSGADADALHGLGADPEKLRVLPNLPDAWLLDRPNINLKETEPQILYLGTLSWEPNIDGLQYFIRFVLPLVRREMPEAQLVIAGRGAPDSLVKLAGETPGVEYVGPIDDPEPLYAASRVFVEASRSGGGTRLKVLNAMARGLPVVVTPEAAEGLEVVQGEHLMMGRGANALSRHIVTLMKDEKQWTALSENARAAVRARYVARTAYSKLGEMLTGAPAR